MSIIRLTNGDVWANNTAELSASDVSISNASGGTLSFSNGIIVGNIAVVSLAAVITQKQVNANYILFWEDATVKIYGKTPIDGFGVGSVSPGIIISAKLVGSDASRIRFFDIAKSYASSDNATVTAKIMYLLP